MQPAVGQHRRVDAGGQLAEVADRRLRVLERVVDQLPRAPVVVPALLGELQADDRADELLLGAVVEIAAEPPALLVAGLEDACPRGGELLARVGVGERVGDQLREGRDALLRVGREAVGAARRPAITAPHSRPATTIGAPTAERMPTSRRRRASTSSSPP